MNSLPQALALSLIVLSTPTSAQDDAPITPEGDDSIVRLTPVIVTARKWNEDVQKVPQSVSVFGPLSLPAPQQYPELPRQ